MVFSLFKKKNKPTDNNSSNLKVLEVIQETPEAISLILENQNNWSYLPGQFLTIAVQPNGEEERRSYSLSSCESTDSNLKISVKRIDNGLVSNYLCDHSKAGQTLSCMQPSGTFTYKPDNKTKNLIFFAAGSGITPIMSMIKSALHDESNSKVLLIYSNKTSESIIFRKELDEYADKFKERFTVVHTLTQVSEDSHWQGETGRIDGLKIKKYLEQLSSQFSSTYYMCGPASMMETISQTLAEMGVSDDQIKQEKFFATQTESIEGDAGSAKTHRIELIYGDEMYEVPVEPGQTILEASLEEGVNIPFSCQSGLCTACRAKCNSGKISMKNSEALSEEEIKDGYILTCVAYTESDGIKVEID
ncbi:ferredoxin--NADP reductase [Aureibacter tunicatorum]|uniref:Ring-1,2-phenylacetyl-CoA epoxidase subunit PaaE n=1 Tax=Aureibacter tunicatorum TaxID=866807 RepID=A0AAE4BUP6_9BACT|nr:ferredoxin--NADP reductase [Aureibacter tunicatorum]MDR6240988.1 ring-1,2-phenylacetyl-CoA epoxidase subunit PaaE [Aureibacter tunicatorum]BDD03767.1 flavodoxin reductase [Aureibacter tunicatorum]